MSEWFVSVLPVLSVASVFASMPPVLLRMDVARDVVGVVAEDVCDGVGFSRFSGGLFGVFSFSILCKAEVWR